MTSNTSKIQSFTVDGNSILSKSLIDQLKSSIDSASEKSCLVIQITGTKDQQLLTWPGSAPQLTVDLISKWEQLLRQIELLNSITCATIEGHCNECGLQLLLAADFRILQKDATININKDGMWPGMAIHRLANQLGTSAARRLVFFAKNISANKAFEEKLVDIIANDIEIEKDKFLSTLTTISLPSTYLRRSLLLEATSEPFETALGSHLAACDRLLKKMT